MWYMNHMIYEVATGNSISLQWKRKWGCLVIGLYVFDHSQLFSIYSAQAFKLLGKLPCVTTDVILQFMPWNALAGKAELIGLWIWPLKSTLITPDWNNCKFRRSNNNYRVVFFMAGDWLYTPVVTKWPRSSHCVLICWWCSRFCYPHAVLASEQCLRRGLCYHNGGLRHRSNQFSSESKTKKKIPVSIPIS